MNIRQLRREEDLDPAIALLQRFFREEGFETPDEIIARNARRMVHLDTCIMLVAEHDGDVVAVATASLEFGIEFGWWAEMGDLYVVPGWRGQGLARRMIAAVESLLQDRGVSGYQVTVTPYAEDHHGLGRFYSGLGFSGDGRRLLMKSFGA